MAVTNWNSQTGAWETAADWSAGEPTLALDAYMNSSATAYTLTLSSAAQAHSLVMNGGPGSIFSETATGSLAARAGLFANTGTAILDGVNAFGAAEINGATVVIGNANALGFTDLTLTFGELTNNTNVALGNNLDISLEPIIAAAHGTTFTVGGTDGWVIDASGEVTVIFGQPGSDGTVVWNTAGGSGYLNSGVGKPLQIVVDAGTLKAGDNGMSLLLDGVPSAGTTVQAGATIDLAGQYTVIDALQGAGRVTSATATTLGLTDSSTFSGQIAGALSVNFEGMTVLTGANTYTGNTNVDSQLQLGAGGTAGSIAGAGAIADTAFLIVDRSNSITIANAISGPGSGHILQIGTGTTILSHANTLAGTVIVEHGTLETTNAGALGSSTLSVQSGARFIAGVNMTVPSNLYIEGGATFAAATGVTLATSASQPWTIGAVGGTLQFGTSAATGTVIWKTPAGFGFLGGGSFAIDIAYGVLKAGDDSFFKLTDADVNHAVTATVIGAAGTLDAAGHPMAITNLKGSGQIKNSGAATTLNFAGGNFSGKINGALTPYMSGVVTLTGGLGTFTASLTIYSGSTLTLAGASAHNYILANNTAAATTLILASGASETGTLHGFIANDTLDLAGVNFATASASYVFNATPSSGVKVTVTDGTHSETVMLAGDYRAATFTLSADAHGGAKITVAGAIAGARQGPASPLGFVSAVAGFAGASAPSLSPSSAPVHRSEAMLAHASGRPAL